MCLLLMEYLFSRDSQILEVLEHVDWEIKRGEKEEMASKILSVVDIDDPTDAERASAHVMTSAIFDYLYEVRRDGLKRYRIAEEGGEPTGRYEEVIPPFDVFDRYHNETSGLRRGMLEELEFHSLVEDVSEGEELWYETQRRAVAVDEELQNAYEAVRPDSD